MPEMVVIQRGQMTQVYSDTLPAQAESSSRLIFPLLPAICRMIPGAGS